MKTISWKYAAAGPGLPFWKKATAGLLLGVFALGAFCSCGGGGKKAAEVGVERAFPQIAVPSLIEDASERMEYVALHYFDSFLKPVGGGDSPKSASGRGSKNAQGKGSGKGSEAPREHFLCDSTHVAGVPSDKFEQAFASWCGVLDMVPMEVAEKAVGRLFERAAACEMTDTASNVLESVDKIIEKYLYDPNSPMRNEDWYRPFLEAKAASDLFPEAVRKRAAETARKCALNKVGTPAADFRFSDRDGRIHSLYGIKAETTLLFFSNPGCNACKEIIDALKGYGEMEPMIARGELAVLNIYIDEDLGEWYKYMPIYPKSWYNGYDPNYVIRTELLYDVRAIPSLYLLNRDKIVLMKDAPVEKVLRAIFGH